ncbi:MYND-type domain-containing protein [Mycena chlorophos]|uniref:MYND-type domain-containing protein n=1 Tax=Mycena chlorophos TaxID=658473 RepID=A0A8H6SBA5_MYCCL|nr:MYND-type domain-containing protein [Mycena chlorophos]
MPLPDFSAELHFPSFPELPTEYYNVSSHFDWQTGRPRVHWCLLAEIKALIPWPMRPMYHVVDRDGNGPYLISFHLTEEAMLRFAGLKAGDTLCIMYAIQHRFMDGQIGVRVEEARSVKVLHCNLGSLFDIQHKIVHNVGKCNRCGKASTLKCARCRLYYCGKECQANDWKAGHKNECKVGKQICAWDFEWDAFDNERWFL